MLVVPVITGLGLVTPLGASVEQTWRALLAGRFITHHARLEGGADRVHDIAQRAASEAIGDSKWNHRRGGDVDRTALVVGTSKGAVETWMTAPPVDSFLESVALAVRESCPLLDGPSITVSSACASGLHALIRGCMMIRGGEADRVLVVGAEASVHPLFLGSFKRLGVLPTEGIGCRPYDEERDGFLMSEAAAAVCLEAYDRPGDVPGLSDTYARVERYAMAADATHMTGSDPAGATLRYLLQNVVAARPVDLIHGHGTGTAINDPVELAAFDDLGATDDHPSPVVYSHKGALGHSLGASGLVSVALNCMMHRRGIALPNVQTRRPLPTRGLHINPQPLERRIRRSIAAAAGFGGPTAVVSLV